MEKKEPFDNWLKSCLEEETQEIVFSAEAKEKVRKSVWNHHEQSLNGTQADESQRWAGASRWWNRQVSLSLRTVSFCLAALLITGFFYTRTFFYVSTQQIAKFEMREKMILHDGGIPFGALQHTIASLEKGRGVDRP